MSIEKHIEEFLTALNGGKGDLYSWLECNNETECREAIFGAIAIEREACAATAEGWAQYYVSVPSIGPRIAAAIRERSNA